MANSDVKLGRAKFKRRALKLTLIVCILSEATNATCPDRCHKCQGADFPGCPKGKCCSSSNWCGSGSEYCGRGGTGCDDCIWAYVYITTTATPNWVTDPITGVEYWINPALLGWDDSVMDCEAVGGSLVKVTSGPANQPQVDFLTSYMADSNVPGSGAWIGCNDKDNEGKFVWTDGSPCSSKWGPEQPDNHNGNENCVELRLAGELNDAQCTPSDKYMGSKVSICQRNATTTITTTTITTTTITTTTTTKITTTTTTRLQVNHDCDPLADVCDKAKNLVCSMDVYECRYRTTSTATTAPAEESGQGGTSNLAGGIAGGAVGGADFLAVLVFVAYRCGKKDLDEVRRRTKPRPASQTPQSERPDVPQGAYGQTTTHNPAYNTVAAQEATYAEIDDSTAYETPGAVLRGGQPAQQSDDEDLDV